MRVQSDAQMSQEINKKLCQSYTKTYIYTTVT